MVCPRVGELSDIRLTSPLLPVFHASFCIAQLAKGEGIIMLVLTDGALC